MQFNILIYISIGIIKYGYCISIVMPFNNGNRSAVADLGMGLCGGRLVGGGAGGGGPPPRQQGGMRKRCKLPHRGLVRRQRSYRSFHIFRFNPR